MTCSHVSLSLLALWAGGASVALGQAAPRFTLVAPAGLSILDELDAQAANSGSKALDDRIRNLENRAATMLTDAAARIEMLSRRVDEAS